MSQLFIITTIIYAFTPFLISVCLPILLIARYVFGVEWKTAFIISAIPIAFVALYIYAAINSAYIRKRRERFNFNKEEELV